MSFLCGCPLKYRNGVPVVNTCLKNTLFVANFLTWVVGTFMLGVGFYAKIDKSYVSGVSGLPLDPVTPILIIGSLIFFVTFFGCVGALRENLCMLKFFSYALAAALILELGAALISVVMSGQVRLQIEDLMKDSIVHYRDDPDLQNIVDWVQEEFKCCGVNQVSDWSNNIYFNCTNDNPSRERCGVPYSCCLPTDDNVPNTLCGMDIQIMEESDIVMFIYTEGCLNAFVSWLHENMFLIAFLLVLLCCVPQILGITISRILIIQIKDQDFYTKIGLLNPRGEFELSWFS